MRVLLDTCAFIWLDSDQSKLGKAAYSVLGQPACLAFLSLASVWELSIKRGQGKLPASQPIEAVVEKYLSRGAVALLPITVRHAAGVERLAPLHRDPFDRMLVAQAEAEALPILSADAAFDRYGIRRIWN